MKPTEVILLAGAAVLVFSGAAAASDIEMAPPSAPMTDSALAHWDGLYVGGHAGYNVGVVSGTFAGFTSIDIDGFSAGGQVGYNVTLGSSNIVVGLEGDLDWTDETGTHAASVPVIYTDRVNWTGAVTGRIGASFGKVMPYLLGGVAVANNTISFAATTPPLDTGEATQSDVGWVVGAGVAAKLAENLSVYAEYRYADYGSRGDSGAPKLVENTIRSGVNFHFD